MTTVASIQQGGTSANSAAAALTNLGAVNRAGDTMTGLLNVANATSIVTTGNVGFGTATPSSRLHIVGTTIIEEILDKGSVTLKERIFEIVAEQSKVTPGRVK